MAEPSTRYPNPVLFLIIVIYLIIGTLYALLTPPWQIPDEPAHYNYVRFVAENLRYPVLQMGDYPHEYLEGIKAKGFPPEMSVDPIRYEFHQPPLYYSLAAPFYWLTRFWPPPQQVIALRFLSLLMGAGIVYLAYLIAREVFPMASVQVGEPLRRFYSQPSQGWNEVLALGTAAFVAGVPMHLAMLAAINNDGLAELMLAGILWMLVGYIKGAEGRRPWRLVGLGVLIGLGILTKTTTLISIPLVLVAVVLAVRHRLFAIRYSLFAIFLPALLLTLPWFVRNAAVYGGLDILGWTRHDAIVVGQPRTADWLAQYGAAGLARDFLLTTFRSFWAQFGWMGVLVDERIYLLLALLCAIVGLGFLIYLVRVIRERDILSTYQRAALGLLALSAFLTLLSYLWYNTKFVQHQGRYLFPALVPLGLFFALGLREILTKERARIVAILALAGLLLLVVKGLLMGDFNKVSMALLGGTALAFGLKGLLTECYDDFVFALPYLGLFALDVICLFGFIVPYFR
jgi:4-amino-4-deoxy-L-arabinose transferase-like glycosyltransferase